jgi:DNA-binding transcriptional MerR regulator
MADRAHLSIGEVLSLLQDDFPDITISKIRFLESQGLLDPERTPSGYRKFYEPDIERLRWILRQQRDNFLPLKIIKDRLAESIRTGIPVEQLGAPAGTLAFAHDAAALAAPVVAPAEPDPVVEDEARPASARPAPAAPVVPAPVAEAPSPRRSLDIGPSGVSMTRDELGAAAGLSARNLDELERFGLLAGRPMGREILFDEEALLVARLAAGFLRFGVEARHLRMYKVAAEREAGFFEQVVMPVVKQRNPAARRRAAEMLHELAGLGEDLRAAMLRQALRDYTASP